MLELATVAEGSTPARALAEATDLARHVERLGYRRLWVAEHHGMPAVASSAPAVLVAHIAAATESVRVGSGGVMLPNHAPLVIAEQFGTLEALHPGRIDLGIGRAPGTDPSTARALRRTADLGAERFPEDLVELIGYFTGGVDHPRAMPGLGYMPELWLLGSSLFSAELAGLLGLPFSFAHHFSPRYTEPALERYRESFRPSSVCPAPHAMVAVAVVCAADDERARWVAGPSALSALHLRTNRLQPLPSPATAAAYPYTSEEWAIVEQVTATHVVGGPETVRGALEALVARTGADELMVTTRVHGHADRLRSFELLAEGWADREVPGGRQVPGEPAGGQDPAPEGISSRGSPSTC